jgi:GAF domain-containing protein
MVEADSVSLYRYQPGAEELEFPPVQAGIYHRDDEDLRDVWSSVAAEQPVFAETIANVPALRREFLDREGIQSCAILALRAAEENVGCMFVNYRVQKHFGEYERRVLSALAASAAIAIRTARVREEEALSIAKGCALEIPR